MLLACPLCLSACLVSMLVLGCSMQQAPGTSWTAATPATLMSREACWHALALLA